jgi:hypothetical protein
MTIMTSPKRAQDQTTSAPVKDRLNTPPAKPTPAAGAHSASHLTNEDATPGSGALTSHDNASGREVDGGAG